MYKNVIDTVTLVVLVIGLVFAGDQAIKLNESIHVANKSIEATNRNTEMSTWNTVAQQWLDVDKVFVEHSELRKYIYEGELPADKGTDKDEAYAAGRYVLDFIDNALTIGHLITNKDITYLHEWENFFQVNIFSKSLVVCHILKTDKKSYSEFTFRLATEPCQFS